MFAVTAITGQVGGVLAASLLARGLPVRAVARNLDKIAAWAALGCETALADMGDASALADAFRGCEGVFILLPPNFDPSPGFPESRAIITAVRSALEQAKPARVVVLSTVGAQAVEPNLLSQLSLLEKELGDLPMPLTYLRPAWFMENLQWDISTAREQGALPSYLHPLDRAIPMVSIEDVGRVAAELLVEHWSGRRIVELAGPSDVSPMDIAEALGQSLGRVVNAKEVPRASWEANFRAQGMRYPEPRMQMLDGFNTGWLRFDGAPRSGLVTLMEVVRRLTKQER